MDTSKILDKMQKLQALATSSNEHEAALAASRLQDLALKYNLSLTDIPTSENEDAYLKEEEGMDVTNNARWWSTLLYHEIARNNFVKILVRGSTKRVWTVGKRHNLEIVKYMFVYLQREIVRLGNEYRRGQDAESKRMRRSFCAGCVSTIGRKLAEDREKAQASSQDMHAMVVKLDAGLNDAMKEFFPRVGKSRGGRWDGSAYGAGRQAGNAINIRQGVGGTSGSGKRVSNQFLLG